MKLFSRDTKIENSDKLLEIAEAFVDYNKKVLSNELNSFLDSFNHPEIEMIKQTQCFLLTGQTVANVFQFAFDNIFINSEFNDLDVFYMPLYAGHMSNLKPDNGEKIEDSYSGFQDDIHIDLKNVYNTGKKITLDVIDVDRNPAKASTIVDLQFVEIRNIFCEYGFKDVENRFEHAAFKILNNFDIYSVKIGLLVDKDLSHVTLIVHPDYVKNMYANKNLPFMRKPRLGSIIRSLDKLSKMISNTMCVGSEVQGYITSYYDNILKIINDSNQLENCITTDDLISINGITFTEKPPTIEETIRINDYINILLQQKLYLKLRNAADALIWENDQDLKFINDYFKKIDNSLKYSHGKLYYSEDKVYNSELIDALNKYKCNIGEVAVNNLQIAQIIESFTLSNNRKIFIKILDSMMAYFSDANNANIGPFASNLFIINAVLRNIDNLIKDFSIGEIVNKFRFICDNKLHNIMLMSSWPEKDIIDLFYQIDVDTFKNIVNESNYNIFDMKKSDYLVKYVFKNILLGTNRLRAKMLESLMKGEIKNNPGFNIVKKIDEGLYKLKIINVLSDQFMSVVDVLIGKYTDKSILRDFEWRSYTIEEMQDSGTFYIDTDNECVFLIQQEYNVTNDIFDGMQAVYPSSPRYILFDLKNLVVRDAKDDFYQLSPKLAKYFKKLKLEKLKKEQK